MRYGPNDSVMRALLAPLQRWFEGDTKGEAIFPLAVLTALYFFDEFHAGRGQLLGDPLPAELGADLGAHLLAGDERHAELERFHRHGLVDA